MLGTCNYRETSKKNARYYSRDYTGLGNTASFQKIIIEKIIPHRDLNPDLTLNSLPLYHLCYLTTWQIAVNLKTKNQYGTHCIEKSNKAGWDWPWLKLYYLLADKTVFGESQLWLLHNPSFCCSFTADFDHKTIFSPTLQRLFSTHFPPLMSGWLLSLHIDLGELKCRSAFYV